MRVKKRSGQYQAVDFNKISNRIKYLVLGVDPTGQKIGSKLNIDPDEIAKKVCESIIDGIGSDQLDEFASEYCAYKIGDHYHYDLLASRIIISNHHKNTENYHNFSDIITALYQNSTPLVSKELYDVVMKSKDILDEVVNRNHNRDYETLDYFGFKTLERSYLLRVKNTEDSLESESGCRIQERFQHLLMREALMWSNDIPRAIECYELLSQSMFTHATPTLFNSGTDRPQLSSCFLCGMDDSIDGMYECIRRLAHISKWAGGIGIWLHKIRGKRFTHSWNEW
jgi:ribonucleotide reductase alpha subunit